MAFYTSIGPEDASKIIDLYNLGEIRTLVPLSHGISNSNYKVELISGQAVILKISNDKNVAELLEEQSILNTLHSLNFSLSLVPFKTKENKLVYEYKNYYGVVFPFIHGNVESPTAEICFKLGEALGKLHRATFNKPNLKIRDHHKVGFDAKEIKDFISSSDCPVDFKNSYQQLLENKIETYLKSALPRGIIHGDFYYDNALFKNNEISVILDFEQAGIGPYLFDLGVAISGTCLKDQKLDKNLMLNYLKGYQSKRPLSLIENELLQTSIIIGLFSIALWRIKRFNLRKIDPTKVDNYKELLDRAGHESIFSFLS